MVVYSKSDLHDIIRQLQGEVRALRVTEMNLLTKLESERAEHAAAEEKESRLIQQAMEKELLDRRRTINELRKRVTRAEEIVECQRTMLGQLYKTIDAATSINAKKKFVVGDATSPQQNILVLERSLPSNELPAGKYGMTFQAPWGAVKQ